MKATNEVYCLAPHLFSQSLTAQALFALKIRGVKTQTAIPCECLLGEGVLCTQADNSNGVAVEATNEVYCLTPHLFSQSLTAQALFALKIRGVKTQTAIPCECLLGEGVLCTQADNSNGVAVEATNEVYCLTPHLFSQSLTAQALFALKIRRAKNSSRNSTRVLAW